MKQLRMSFLSGEFKAYFEAFDKLDIIELRALVYVMPEQFLYDTEKDAPKAAWLTRLFNHVSILCVPILPVRNLCVA
jgi:hypothetical protein